MTDGSKALVVTHLFAPDDSDPTELEGLSWSDMEAEIRRLDGDNCSLVVLGIGELPTPHMAIGGGEGGKTSSTRLRIISPFIH